MPRDEVLKVETDRVGERWGVPKQQTQSSLWGTRW